MICKTTAEMKEIDRIAIEERGMDSLQLMESAARHVATIVESYLARTERQGTVVIFCGPGNNGGDGFACAWMLWEKGISAKVCFIGKEEKMTADARAEQTKFLARGGIVEIYDGGPISQNTSCLVDAIFGIGLKRTVGGMFAQAIAAINHAHAAGIPAIACDIPSGIDGNTGKILGIAVEADETITFSCAKPGLLIGEGKRNAGRLTICDIGIPNDLLED